jgi:DNA ligase-1
MKLINLLRSTNSRVLKEQALKDISYAEWRTFVQAYHPDYIYHLKFVSVGMDNLGEPSEAMFELLDKIIYGTYKGKKARERVHSFASANGDLIKLICNKDLNCGVTAKTFNKVFPDSIPMFEVQLAKEVPLKEVKYPVLAQIKYDGVRIIAKVEERICTFKTRNGKIVHLPELAAQIEDMPFDNYILDGELVLAGGLQEDRTKISGMVNSAMHGGRVDESDMVLYCFDTMPLSNFDAAHCDDIYEDRFTVLRSILASTMSPQLELAPTNEIHNAEAATLLYEGALAMGYEGLVLKYPNHKYTFKRSKDWIKIKEVKHADLRVVDIQEGTGKYEGMIGALVCVGEVEGKRIRVSVGSGLSDIQRGMDDIEFIQETVEVLYNSVIKDSITNEWSLFLPRFVQVRHDK